MPDHDTPSEVETASGPTWLMKVNGKPIASCACHPEQWAIDCVECGRRALAYRSRAGIDRIWHRDTSGWACACGAGGGLLQLVGIGR
ncbi:MAG: hypothetical protein ACR2I5_05810 [Candidatus Limnocylindria bacterium]